MTEQKAEAKVEAVGEQELLSLDEAAAALGVSRSSFSRWLTQGKIRGMKVGRQWRFQRSDLDKFVKMAHPSAAGVNVNELDDVIAQLSQELPGNGKIEIAPAAEGYPGTEEEEAIERLLSVLLATAIKARASDLHIEATREGTCVRRRVDGVLHEMLRLPSSAHGALVACIKSHSGVAVDQTQLPQDGRFSAKLGNGREGDIRASFVPGLHGETVTMRFFEAGTPYIRDLATLGMKSEDIGVFVGALKKPSGLIILTGPSGSGKTTTIYAGLRELISPEKKTLTVEDPVEYILPWTTQIPVNRKAGLTFASGLRACMRQDPDILMVGAIRDFEVLEASVNAALTGHIVLSTVYTNDAPTVITRLVDMGLDPFLAACLTCIVAQRLVRLVCKNCAEPDQPDISALLDLAQRARAGGYELPKEPTFMRGKGCPSCRNTGYAGRTALYEVMEMTPEIQELIVKRVPLSELREAVVAGGTITLAAEGLRKAAEGLTTVVEVMRVLPFRE
jgi:excisionase family DNA binding protein